jgi:hypothetical protein
MPVSFENPRSLGTVRSAFGDDLHAAAADDATTGDEDRTIPITEYSEIEQRSVSTVVSFFRFRDQEIQVLVGGIEFLCGFEML